MANRANLAARAAQLQRAVWRRPRGGSPAPRCDERLVPRTYELTDRWRTRAERRAGGGARNCARGNSPTFFPMPYGPTAGVTGFYAMDVVFQFDDEGTADGKVQLFIKQARPYKGRNQ